MQIKSVLYRFDLNFPVSLKAVFPPDKGGQGGFRAAAFPDFSNQTGIFIPFASVCPARKRLRFFLLKTDRRMRG